MHSVTVHMDRVFDVQPDTFSGNIRRTLFSFESDGKRHLSVLVSGDVKPMAGQTITAVLKRPGDWQTVRGIRIHETGEIFAPGIGLDIWLLLLLAFSAAMFYMNLQHSRPEVLLPVLAGHALIAAFGVRRLIVTQQIRRSLRPQQSQD